MATSPRKRQSSAPAPVRVIRQADAAEQAAPIVAQTPPAASLPDLKPAASGRFAGFTFTAVKAGSGGSRVSRTAGPIERPSWPAEVREAADRIGFYLPDAYPARRDRKDGRKAPWRLCAMPETDALLLPITEPAQGGHPSAQFMGGLIWGFSGMIPSLASGEGLPLLDVLELFANPTVYDLYLKCKAWQTLTPRSFNGKQVQNTTTLLQRIADHSNRYCYCENATLYITDKADS